MSVSYNSVKLVWIKTANVSRHEIIQDREICKSFLPRNFPVLQYYKHILLT